MAIRSATMSGLPDPALRAEARRLYGADAVGYETGRPDYPERVFELLASRCGLGAGIDIVEIGPGTGRVTARLAALGCKVVAIEPDPGLAAYLRDSELASNIELVEGSFEDVELPEERFDLAVAAMSFHWVVQEIGFPKVRRILRPGGWVALWWTVFGDRSRDDPFHDAARSVIDEALGPGGNADRLPLELDVAAWMQRLSRLGRLHDIDAELINWTARFHVDELRAFYGSMIAIRRLPGRERERLLDALESVASSEFGGVVNRPFVTAIYTARRS